MSKQSGKGILLAIAYLGFVSLGLPDAIAGVAWPSLRDTFDLSQSGLGSIMACLGVGYLSSSFFTGELTRKLGIARLLTLSSGLVAASLLGYGTAGSWTVFLISAFTTGLGSGAIDAGLNSYAAEKFSVKHMNWLHASYSLGAMLGPLLMTALLIKDFSWRWGYLMLAFALIVMTTMFITTRKQWVHSADTVKEVGRGAKIGQTLAKPVVWLQMLLFFLYTGLEMTSGQWCFTYFTESRGVDVDLAGLWTGAYYGSILVGRILLGWLINKIGEKRMLLFSMLGSVLGAMAFVLLAASWASFVGLLIMGLAFAPIFPTLMSQTPDRVGRSYATQAIGFQVSAAMVGIIALPALVGVLSVNYGLTYAAGVIPLVSVLMALVYFLLTRFSKNKI